MSSLKNMTHLEALKLNWRYKNTGSLEDLEGLVNLRVLTMSRVKEVEGPLSHIQNMPLTYLDLAYPSKVERSLSHLHNMPLTYLKLFYLSKVEGSPPKHAVDDPILVRNGRIRHSLEIPHFSLQGTNHPMRFHPCSQDVRSRGEDRRTDLRTLSKLGHKRRVPLRH